MKVIWKGYLLYVVLPEDIEAGKKVSNLYKVNQFI